MEHCINNTHLLIKTAFYRRCVCISRHWRRLWGRGKDVRTIQRQMSEQDLQDNFYGQFLKWLYAIEAATFEGSRLIVLDILSRFPLVSEPERKRLTVTEFLENLSRIYGEIIGAAVSGQSGILKVKCLEISQMTMSYAEGL